MSRATYADTAMRHMHTEIYYIFRRFYQHATPTRPRAAVNSTICCRLLAILFSRISGICLLYAFIIYNDAHIKKQSASISPLSLQLQWQYRPDFRFRRYILTDIKLSQ